MNFEFAGVLPERFMAYALDVRLKDPFPRDSIHRKEIPVGRTRNLVPMWRVARILIMAVDHFGEFYGLQVVWFLKMGC